MITRQCRALRSLLLPEPRCHSIYLLDTFALSAGLLVSFWSNVRPMATSLLAQPAIGGIFVSCGVPVEVVFVGAD